MLRFKDVAEAYQGIPGGGTRLGELWRPIGAVLQALAVDQDEYEAVRDFFMAGALETRHEPTTWETRLLEVLAEQAEKHLSNGVFSLTPKEILGLLNLVQGPGVKWVGDTLSQYSLYREKRRGVKGGVKETIYTFECQKVKDLVPRYLGAEKNFSPPTPPQMSCPSCPPGKNASKNNDLRWTQAKMVDMSYPVHPVHPHPQVDTTGHVHPKPSCPPQVIENTGENMGGHDWTRDLGGDTRKNFSDLSTQGAPKVNDDEWWEELMRMGEEEEDDLEIIPGKPIRI